MRGIAGFGAKQRLRTDRLLTLSEDLPLVSVAVDTRERIQAALADVDVLRFDGLVTLERAWMATGPLGAVELPADLHNEATKLTVYLGRQQRAGSRPAYEAVVDLLHRHGVAGATVLLGVDGTAHGARQRARFFAANADVPLMVISVGHGPQIAAALPELDTILRRPLATLERVRICKRDGQRIAATAPRARDRRLRPAAAAKAHGLRVRTVPLRRRPALHGARTPPTRSRRRRRHQPPRHLGLPRRPHPARRHVLAATPPRPRAHRDRRQPRQHPPLVRHRRRSSPSRPGSSPAKSSPPTAPPSTATASAACASHTAGPADDL